MYINLVFIFFSYCIASSKTANVLEEQRNKLTFSLWQVICYENLRFIIYLVGKCVLIICHKDTDILYRFHHWTKCLMLHVPTFSLSFSINSFIFKNFSQYCMYKINNPSRLYPIVRFQLYIQYSYRCFAEWFKPYPIWISKKKKKEKNSSDNGTNAI